MRIITKIGDIFEVKIDEKEKKFFQLIAFDLTQLNSDVIRAFKQAYPINSVPDFGNLVHGEVDFYAHCVTKIGIKMGFWEKVGKAPEIGDLNHILFRDSEDYGNHTIKISYKWWVWKINEEQRRVGKLTGENKNAEIGLVFNPKDIVGRMRTGEYDLKNYPKFE